MKAEISLITIWTDNMEPMKEFYCNTLGFTIKNDLGDYLELNNRGVRFAICKRSVMSPYSDTYRRPCDNRAQRFELAFPCETKEEVDSSFKRLIIGGAGEVHAPADMPWGQRTALFSDPDGNIHEIFANLNKE